MKKNRIIIAFLLAAIGITSKANSNNSGNKSTQNTTPIVNEVVFKKGKLIEVAFLSIKKGREKQLTENYFPKVMPIVLEYGGKPLMKIGVKNKYSKNINAQMVVFFEWPSAAKKEAFERDPRFLKIKKTRTKALSFLQLSFFKVEKNMSVQLDDHKFYEVYGMSMNRKNGHLMQKYFEKAGPITTTQYGVDFALSMSPVRVKIAGHHNYSPQTFGIAIWPNEAANTKFFRSKEYAKIKHYKEKALKQIDVWQGNVILK
jgi:uncharacterized protein (DUF1330 family)